MTSIKDDELEGLGAARIDINRLSINRDVVLGKGGYGTVFLGKLGSEKSAAGRQVAVKQLRSDETQDLRVAVRLTKEMKAWCQLQHSNILPLLGFYLSEKLDVALIISPYVSLGDIPNYLNGRTVSFMKRLDLCLDALNGLMYLHKQGYCHGDIKPANLLVNSATKAMLTDFGLVKAVTQDAPHISSTSSGFKGSVRYSSPEVLDGKPRSTSSDMWAFGCTVMEITTGSHPYPFATGDTSIIASILWKRETPDQGITLPGTVDLWVVLRGCWHFEAIERATAAECIAKYYIMLATHYTPGVLEGAVAGPAHEGGQQPWQRILKQLAAPREPRSVSDTLHVSRWKAAAVLGIQHWEGTRTDPETSLPRLARSLQTLSQDISNLGRAGEGIILQQEACAIFRALTVQGHPENQTYLIEGLCRSCTLATEMKMAGEAFRAITEAVDLRCRDLYAYQTVQAVRECLIQLNTCVTRLGLYEEGSTYIKNKVVALRASVKGLSVGRGDAPLTSYREVMGLRDGVSGGSERKKLHRATRAISSIGTAPGSKSQSSLAGSALAWNTQSMTNGIALATERPPSAVSPLSPETTGNSSGIGYGYRSYSTLTLSSQEPGASTLSLAADHNLLEYVRLIAFSLQLRGSYLRKLARREDEAAETMNEAVHVYMKISSPGQSLSNPPHMEIAPPLYTLASELFDMQRFAESKTAVEEAIRIYTFYVLDTAEHIESMYMCRKLLDDVKKGIERGGGHSRLEEGTSQGRVLRKPSPSKLASETKAAAAKANREDVWGLNVGYLDPNSPIKEDTKGGGSQVESYVWTPGSRSQRHSRDAPPRITERDLNLDTTPPHRRPYSSYSPQISSSGKWAVDHGAPRRSSLADLSEERPWSTLKELEGYPYGSYPNTDDSLRPNHQEQTLPSEVGSDRRHQDRSEGRSLRSSRSERMIDAHKERDRRDKMRDAPDKTPSRAGHANRSAGREKEGGGLADGRRLSFRDDESYNQLSPATVSVRDETKSMSSATSSHVPAIWPSRLLRRKMPSESGTPSNPWVHGQEIIAQQKPTESTVNRGKAQPTESSTGRLSRRSVRAAVPDRQPLWNVTEGNEPGNVIAPKGKAHVESQGRGAKQSINLEELPAPPPEDDMDDRGHRILTKKRKRASTRLLSGDLIPRSRDQPTGSGTAARRGFFGRLLERFRHHLL
ncbi:hypothetical protein FRB93_003100 [Tulasnella sp. JGI-2019a]|nr:hypothetical protein FRB93_003100 [Tulasnella sp. JGI-2019a]